MALTKLRSEIKAGKYTIRKNTRFNTYYDSDEWENTRTRMLKRDDAECQSCGETAECVHHITYERLGEENDLDLISLCDKCHEEVHRRQDLFRLGYRLTPEEIRTLEEWEFVLESGETNDFLS